MHKRALPTVFHKVGKGVGGHFGLDFLALFEQRSIVSNGDIFCLCNLISKESSLNAEDGALHKRK